MPKPYFTSNPADYTKLEGLYITEKNPPGFVRGVSLSEVGIYGTAVKGPVDTAIEITSEKRFREVFGADRYAAGGGAIVSELWKALLNKPFGTLHLVRCAASDAVAATFDVEDAAGGAGTPIVTIAASSVGAWGNDVAWKVEAASDGDTNHWNLRLRYLGEEFLYENLDTTTDNDNLSTVIPSIDDQPAVLVQVTKLADGRPVNSAASTDGADADGFTYLGATTALFTTVAGDDGTIAAADYTGTGKGLNILAERKGVAVVFCASEDATITAAVNTATVTAAATVSDRVFIIHKGDLTGANVAPSAIETDADGLTRLDRVIYAHNAAWTMDPEVGQLVLSAPSSWLACILSQTDVDVHPGEEATKRFLAGISKLDDESLSRGDYITLKEAGVCSLERDSDGGFLFVSGVTMSLTTGLTEITRRRSADYLQLSSANALKHFVKKKGTTANRARMGGLVDTFLAELQRQGRIVEEYEIDQVSQNTDASRAQGLEYILMRVKLIGHMLHLVLQTEIGTGVTIEVAA